MFPQHIIAKKRDGRALTRDELAAFVRGATDGSWADYQLSALLMAPLSFATTSFGVPAGARIPPQVLAS